MSMPVYQSGGGAGQTMLYLAMGVGLVAAIGGGIWYVTNQLSDPFVELRRGYMGGSIGCDGDPDLLPSKNPEVGPKWCIVPKSKAVQKCKSIEGCIGYSTNKQDGWRGDYPGGVQLIGDGGHFVADANWDAHVMKGKFVKP